MYNWWIFARFHKSAKCYIFTLIKRVWGIIIIFLVRSLLILGGNWLSLFCGQIDSPKGNVTALRNQSKILSDLSWWWKNITPQTLLHHVCDPLPGAEGYVRIFFNSNSFRLFRRFKWHTAKLFIIRSQSRFVFFVRTFESLFSGVAGIWNRKSERVVDTCNVHYFCARQSSCPQKWHEARPPPS